jgi:hypothetical protein
VFLLDSNVYIAGFNDPEFGEAAVASDRVRSVL